MFRQHIYSVLSEHFYEIDDPEWPHKWVILRMTPTAPLSYHSCQKHYGARTSRTLLEGFDPRSQ